MPENNILDQVKDFTRRRRVISNQIKTALNADLDGLPWDEVRVFEQEKHVFEEKHNVTLLWMRGSQQFAVLPDDTENE